MNDIQVGRYSGILHKLLGITEGSPAPTLAPEIFPMIVLESERPEWAFLGNERLAQYSSALGASAGNYSMAGLWVPAGSNIIAVVDQVTVFRAAGRVYCRMCLETDVSTGTAQDGVMRDSRLYGVGAAAQGFFDALAAVPGSLLDFLWCDGAESITRDVEYVLTPGHALYWYPEIVNLGLSMCVRWRERVLEPSETR